MIPRLHVPLIEPEDVVRHLGKQEKHWKEGRSAHALAHAWARQNGLPGPVLSILQKHPVFQSAELIDGFLERQVDIGSAGRPSQTDLLAVIGLKERIAIVAIEAKAGEPFGDTVEQWRDGSDGKNVRLAVLCETLGLSIEDVNPLRYQLLHRSASAICEAKRYRTDLAGMLVHSFGPDQHGFSDFCRFLQALGVEEPKADQLFACRIKGVSFFIGWVSDKAHAEEDPSAYLADLRDYASRLSQWCDRVRAWCEARIGATRRA